MVFALNAQVNLSCKTRRVARLLRVSLCALRHKYFFINGKKYLEIQLNIDIL